MFLEPPLETLELRGGDICLTEEGGEAGSAVCIAFRKVGVRLGERLVVAKGDDVRRLPADSSEGEGGETARAEAPEDVREWEIGTAVVLTDRDIPFDMIRDLEGGEVDTLSGEDGRVVVVGFREGVLGEPARLTGGICEAEVA